MARSSQPRLTQRVWLLGPTGRPTPFYRLTALRLPLLRVSKLPAKQQRRAVALAAISSGTNEDLTIDAKGSGTITLNSTGTGLVHVGSSLTYIANTEVVDATNVITAAETGTTFFLNDATEFASTLPAPAAGLNFKFIVTGAPSGADYTVGTNSAADILIGGVSTAADGTAAAVDQNGDVITFADGVAVAGDWVEVISDGTYWYVSGWCAAAAGITITNT